MLQMLGPLNRLNSLNRRAGGSLALHEHYGQTSNGVAAPTNSARRALGKQQTLWILSRSLYRVKSIALANVAANRRASAIQLELTAWTPFRDTAHYVLPQGPGESHALLMAWDKEMVASAQMEAGVSEQDLPVVPETALRATVGLQPANSTIPNVTTYACLDGVEAVVTANGITTLSQWWSAAPNQATWLNFQRVAGMTGADVALRSQTFPAPQTVQTAQNAAWLARPLGYARGQANAPDAARETWIIAAVALILAIPTIWFANDYRRHAVAESAAETRLKDTEQELDGLLGARGNAVGMMARAAKFDTIFNQNDALNVFADVSRSLSTISKPGAMVLTEWDWRADGVGNIDSRSKRLKMVFSGPGPIPSVTALVKAFEANPAFRDVQVNAEGPRLLVEMRVEPARVAVVSAQLPSILPTALPTASPTAQATPALTTMPSPVVSPSLSATPAPALQTMPTIPTMPAKEKR